MSGNCQRIFARFCAFSHKIAKVFLGVYHILDPFPRTRESSEQRVARRAIQYLTGLPPPAYSMQGHASREWFGVWEWFGAWVKYWWGQTSGLSPGMGGYK